jgi:hypothetical protein
MSLRTSGSGRKNVSKDGGVLTGNPDAEDLRDVVPETIGEGFGFVEIGSVPK